MPDKIKINTSPTFSIDELLARDLQFMYDIFGVKKTSWIESIYIRCKYAINYKFPRAVKLFFSGKNPKKTKVGDAIKSIFSDEVEIVKSISHKDHGIKPHPEDYCCINGMYYSYQNFEIMKKGA